MFPIPGRKAKDASPNTITAPLSKAQRLLGTGEINVDYKGLPKGHDGWDTYSTSGMSIAVSDSSMGGRTNTTYRPERYDSIPELTFDNRDWDDESDVVPRHLHSAGGLGLRSQRSAATLGADYLSADNATDLSSLRRRQSNSTIGTHYDKSHVPLSVSQQTSNSAIALGTYFDQFHPDTIAANRKKRPSKLDLLRGKVRNDPPGGAKTASPHLGGGHTLVRSPSMMSFKTSWGSSSPNAAEQRTPKKLVRRSQLPRPDNLSPTAYQRPLHDASGLHQLYDHYEEMSFRNAPSPTVEDMPSFLTSDPFETGHRPTTSHTSISLPATRPLIREPQSPSDKSSTRTRDLTSGSGASEAMDSTISSITDYAASISSRQTHNSKTSRNDRSIQSLDRQQNSVLSLSDSDSDDDSIPQPSASPLHSSSKLERSLGLTGFLSDATYSPTPERSRIPISAQIKPVHAFLDIPRTSSRTAASRPISNNTSHSQQSSTSTISPRSGTSVSSDGAQRSVHSRAFDDEAQAPFQQAHSVTMLPLSSRVAPVAEVMDQQAPMSDFQAMLAGPTSRSKTRDSKSSDQPTPPLSPNSVEFYFRSPESIRRGSVASNSSEKTSARFMAVTHQEEMLLAALREKRAKMRASSLSSGSGAEKVSRNSAAAPKLASGQPIVIPQRRSSVHAADAPEHKDFGPKSLGTLREESSLPVASDSQESSPGRPSLTTSTGQARQERVLLYLDRPISGVGAIDLAEPSPDLTEFMGSIDGRSDDEWADENGRARIKSTRWTTFSKHGFLSRNDVGRPRADSALVNPNMPGPVLQRLSDLPETESEDDDDDDDLYLDDFDFDDFPEPGGKVATRPADNTHASTGRQGLPPSLPPLPTKKPAQVFHQPKRSLARLSAVGGPSSGLPSENASSPVPWWGDDD